MQASKRAMLVAGVLGLALVQGCATKVKATATVNPAPAEAFSAYGRIAVKPVRVASGQRANQSGVAKIQANLDKDLANALADWNKRAENGRSLVIEPVIEQMEFTHGASRVLFGPLAGSSGVLMRLKISDALGNQVASPEFFQRADAWAAGFVLGVHDNLMLTRVANLASEYIIANYSVAKGGPTGADIKAVRN